MQENIVKRVCKELETANILLQNQKINKNDFFLVDASIKELIKTRNTIDFIHKEQITPTNWNEVLKAIK